MNDLAKSVKNVMTVFLVLFIALISYIAYFQLIKSPKINEMASNTRVIAKKNEVLRGTIYDRNETALTTSERLNETSQKRNYLYDGLYVHALGYTSAVYGKTGLEEEYDSELTTYNAIGNNFRKFLDSIDIKGLIEDIKNDKESTGNFNFASNFKTFKDKINFNLLEEEENKVGNGVITTLDTTLQQVASDALGSNKGAVVALNPKTGEILTSPFMSSIVIIISLLFLIPGIAYGIGSREIKNSNQVVNLMSKSMSSMGSYIILVFFAAQFVAYFSYTNIGTVIAVQGADFLKNIGLKGIPLILLFILVAAFINIFMGSASAKWAIMAPIFVPMLYQVNSNMTPEVVAAAYRVADSSTNIITPLMSYAGIILVYMRKYKPEYTVGDMIRLMMPYSISFLIGWTILLLGFFAFGIPFGF